MSSRPRSFDGYAFDETAVRREAWQRYDFRRWPISEVSRLSTSALPSPVKPIRASASRVALDIGLRLMLRRPRIVSLSRKQGLSP